MVNDDYPIKHNQDQQRQQTRRHKSVVIINLGNTIFALS